MERRGVHGVHVPGYRRREGLLSFRSAATTAVNTRRAVAECLESALGEGSTDCDLLLYHTTIGHSFDEIRSEARRLAPSARLVGCTGLGVIGSDGPKETMRSLAVMAIRGPASAFAVAGRAGIDSADLFSVGADLARDLADQTPGITIVLCYPSYSVLPGSEFLRGVESVLGPDVPVVGGYAIDSPKLRTSYQFLDGQTFEMGVVAVGLADPSLELVARVNHGYRPMGEPLQVTRSEGVRIYEIDGRPAWVAFTGALGMPATTQPVELGAIAMLGKDLDPELREEYGSDYIVVGGVLKQPDDSVIVASACPQGTLLRIMERDEDGIFAGAERLAGQLAADLRGRVPVAVFHADCAVRGRLSFNRVLKEELIQRIQEPVCRGESVPWLGIYGGSELCPLGGRTMVHVFTSSIYALAEREGPVD